MSVVNAEKVAKRIKQLPPLPMVVQKLLSVVDDGGSSARDVGNVLSTDQALTSKVLKLVNSAFYGLPRQVPTITRAVVILGYAAVRNLIAALASFDSVKKLGTPENEDRFWEHALTVAVGAQNIASLMKYPEPEEAFIAGLLHDIGHLIIDTALPQEYKITYKEFGPDALSLEREEHILGVTHTDAGTRLLEQWQLPEQLCRVTRFHHSPNLGNPAKEPLISIIMLADMIASIKDASFAEVRDTELFLRITDEAGISIGEYGKLITRMDEKIRDARTLLQAGKGARASRPEPPSPGETPVVAFIGDNERHLQWTKSLLEAFGYTVIAGSASDTGDRLRSANLVIIDAAAIEKADLIKLGALLGENDHPVAALVMNGVSPYGDAAAPAFKMKTIPFLFTHTDIKKLVEEAQSNASQDSDSG